MGEETGGQTGGKSGFGCAKMAGVGCLVLIVLGVVVGLVVWAKWEGWARAAGAAGVELVAEEMMSELGLTEEEKDGAMGPVREFAQQIRDGEVTLAQAIAVGEELVDGPAFAVLLTRGFEGKYLAASELSDAEKQEGHVTLTRFAQGVSTERIPTTKAEEISQIVTIETTDSEGETTKELKETITTEELKSCLAIMKDSADAAGVEDREFTFDLAEEIRKAIENGMGAPSGTAEEPAAGESTVEEAPAEAPAAP